MNRAKVAEGAADYADKGSIEAMLDKFRQSGKNVALNLPDGKSVKIIDEYLNALTDAVLDHSPSLREKSNGGVENIKALVFSKLSSINMEVSPPANDPWASTVNAKDLRVHDGGLRGSLNIDDIKDNIRRIALYIGSVENDISYRMNRGKLGGDLKDLVLAEMKTVVIGSGLEAKTPTVNNGSSSIYEYSGPRR